MEAHKRNHSSEGGAALVTDSSTVSEIAGATQSAQYDVHISKEYTNLVETDPQKQFVQYPCALHFLGSVSGKQVLDVGCGSGLFDRELLERGAVVTGYDVSADQIENANKSQEDETIKAKYIVSDPKDFTAVNQFDKAVSVLVLHYARDKEHLGQFFSTTYRALKSNGEFVCILVNPNFKRLGEILYNRRFYKPEAGRMKADFFGMNQELRFSVEFSDFSTEDYEQAAHTAGFKSVEWKPLQIEQEGLDKMGGEYWNGFQEDCLYIGFIAHK